MTPVCSLCGAHGGAADSVGDGDPPLGWSADLVDTGEGPRTRWVCVSCTRRYVRLIEAKLDQDWW